MRKLGCLLGLIFLLSLTAAAQDAPKVEIFGGYSYLRVKSFSAYSFDGGSGSVSFNAKPTFGIVADVGVYHTGNFVAGGSSNGGKIESYLFGPRIMMRGSRVDPFVQALFGGAHASAAQFSQYYLAPTIYSNSFAMALGGGIDVKAGPHLAIRIIQAELLMTRFNLLSESRETQKNARISVGVVFRLGKR